LHSLSIVIPAYNEEKRLPSSLSTISNYLATKQLLFREIIVVNDGSTDATADCVREFARRDAYVRLLNNPGNRGKGYSVRNGMLHAEGEWILSSDADLSTPITELETLYQAARHSQAKVAIGSRALNRELIGVPQPLTREYAGKLFNLAMRGITGLPFRDTQCGFKLFHRAAAARIFPLQRIEGFGFDVEDLFIAAKLRIRTIEVPVQWNNVEGTKVSLWQGIDSFLDPLRIRAYEMQGKYRQ
jgi:glycosyltransferase involved in cell wall biosynthesis